MSAFNTIVEVPATCPHCHAEVVIGVQFKFGDTWQYDYKVGDVLRWGGNDVGAPAMPRVVVDGEGDACPACGFDEFWSFYVFVEHDRIVGVSPADGTYDFVHSELTYLNIADGSEGPSLG